MRQCGVRRLASHQLEAAMNTPRASASSLDPPTILARQPGLPRRPTVVRNGQRNWPLHQAGLDVVGDTSLLPLRSGSWGNLGFAHFLVRHRNVIPVGRWSAATPQYARISCPARSVPRIHPEAVRRLLRRALTVGIGESLEHRLMCFTSRDEWAEGQAGREPLDRGDSLGRFSGVSSGSRDTQPGPECRTGSGGLRRREGDVAAVSLNDTVGVNHTRGHRAAPATRFTRMTVGDVLGSVDELADGTGGSRDAVTGVAIGPHRKSRMRR